MTYRHIGLVIGTDCDVSRRALCGIGRFVRESRQPWLLDLTPHHEPDLKALAAWKSVGILALLPHPRLVDQILALDAPVVNVAFWVEDPRLPHVGNDNAAIGRAAAEHLLARRFARFAFVGWTGFLYSDQQEAGFRAAGYDCVCYRGRRWFRMGSAADHEKLCEWIASLATPVGIMAFNDVRAWQVLRACREVGRHVPEEIAVVGVDNDEAWCLLAEPPLSSVAVAAEQVGYRAAAKLARLLAGRRVRRQMAVPPLGVVTRRSSDSLAIGDPTVAGAVHFIWEHSERPIDVADVLAAVPVSRRALERGFRRALGRSPATEICQAHLRRAKELLASTELNMADVARGSGFTSARHLATVFRQHTGMTATSYRQQFRFTPSPGAEP